MVVQSANPHPNLPPVRGKELNPELVGRSYKATVRGGKVLVSCN